jgi:hypothetical protein
MKTTTRSNIYLDQTERRFDMRGLLTARGKDPMKRNTSAAVVLCLAVLGTAIEARAECQGGQYLRGSIAETRIASPNDPSSRFLGNVTGVLNGASTVFLTGTPPNVTSFDTFVTTQGDMLTATGLPTRTPIPGAPPGEFTIHTDLTITGGSGKYAGATGWMTFDGQSHNLFGGVGVATIDLVYRGCVSGPNIKADGN